MLLRRLRAHAGVIALLTAFLVGRLAVWFREPVYVSADSPGYRGGTGLTFHDVLSLTGNAPRPWGTPLFYFLFPDDGARAFGQCVVGTVAWALLTVVLYAYLRNPVARHVAAASVLVVGLTKPVTDWDLYIGSESLSISLAVASVALFIWYGAGGRRAVLIALTATAFWWTFIRPELRVLVGFLIVGLVLLALFERSRRKAALVAATVLVGAAGWLTANFPASERAFSAYTSHGLNLTESTFIYRLRFQVMPKPDVLRIYRRDLGMPACPAAERVAHYGAWRISEFVKAYQSCPELAAWGHKNAGSSGFRFAEAATHLYLHETLKVLPATLSGDAGHGVSVLPKAVERTVWPSTGMVLNALTGAYLVALLLAAVSGAFRRRKTLVYTSLGTMAAALVSTFLGLMYAAGQYARFGIQETVLIHIAILLMAVGAIDALAGRVRDQSTAEAPAEPDPAQAEPAATQHIPVAPVMSEDHLPKKANT
ncbi:MAG TPA: hypothetical protein VGJ95_16285 [Pseudonocardiaceae bacterium]|jgi:hypothetical protein